MADEYWRARPLSKFKGRKVDWLVPGFFPLGFISTVTGDGEVGKSTLIYDLLARVTDDGLMPTFGDDKEHVVRPGSVLILCKEDDPGSMIKPRLRAAGADMSKVYMVAIHRSSDKEDFEVLGRLDNTIGDLESIVGEIGDVRAILIDPITDFAGQLDLYREDQVRRLLGPLARLAARHNIAVINVLHLIKDTRKKPRQRILGSVGLVNISRAVAFVGKGQGTGRGFLMMEKANLWPERKAVAFVIKSLDGQPVIEWDADYEAVNIDEVLAGKSIHVTKQQQAAFKLRAWLTDDGALRSVEICERAEKLGIHFNTFKAAKKELGIVSRKRDDGWWWQLPKGETKVTPE